MALKINYDVHRNLRFFKIPETNNYIVTYYKNGHNAIKNIADDIYSEELNNQGHIENGSTETWTKFLTAEKGFDKYPDVVYYIIRHPLERFIAGVKERILGLAFGNLRSVFRGLPEYEHSLVSKYMTQHQVVEMVHTYEFWDKSMDLISFDPNELNADDHTANYLETVKFLIKNTDTKQVAFDMKDMTYQFATQELYVPLNHTNNLSPFVDDYILDIFKIRNMVPGITEYLKKEGELYFKILAEVGELPPTRDVVRNDTMYTPHIYSMYGLYGDSNE